MENLTTILSPSSSRPVFLMCDTTNGHTPKIFATKAPRPDMERSFVLMAFRNTGRDAIQSRVSEPVKQFTTNSVPENGSNLPNTDAAVRTVPTSHLACKNLCQNTRTCMQRNNRCNWTSSIQNFSQNRNIQCSISPESAQHRNTNTAKCGSLPRPHHHPNL